MNRALQLVHVQSDEDVFARDWSRAVAATCAWGMCPTMANLFVARAAWQRVEGDWLRLLVGRR